VASSFPLAKVLKSISSALTDDGTSFALVGGLAVSTRAEPRVTRDIDLAVAVLFSPLRR
jgi:hypothetical protein